MKLVPRMRVLPGRRDGRREALDSAVAGHRVPDLHDPHTLVLDEATALLDSGAARRLERSLAAVLEGRSVVAIAHRLHTARDADRIAVVEEGRVTELGSHDDLLQEGGAYAALWHSWRDDH